MYVSRDQRTAIVFVFSTSSDHWPNTTPRLVADEAFLNKFALILFKIIFERTNSILEVHRDRTNSKHCGNEKIHKQGRENRTSSLPIGVEINDN